MNPYPSPSSITMQRPGENSVNITLEDAVVIMTNQQKTIDELIKNNQKMYQYIQEVQSMGVGNSGVQFVQQNLSDPASHVMGTGAGAPSVQSKPMTLSEYLASKNSGGAAASQKPAAAPAAASNTLPSQTKPVTLSEYLASKNAGTTSLNDNSSKLAPDTGAPNVYKFN